MNKKYSLLGVFFMLLMLSAPAARADASVSVFVRAGDEFTYTINSLLVKETINGTVDTDIQPYENDTTANIVIDVVTEDNTAGTYVNFTATIDDTEEKGSTFANDFTDYFYDYLGLTISKSYGYPNGGNFEGYFEEEESSELDIPFIVTDNGTYFRDLKTTLLGLEEFLHNGDDLTFDSNVNYFSEEEKFEMNMLMDYHDEEANNSNGDAASLDIRYENVVEADVSQSIVTSFFLSLRHELIVGDASALTEIVIDFSQGGGSLLDNLPVEINAPFYSLLIGMTGLVLLIRTKRKY